MPREQWETLAAARALVDYAKQVLPIARMGRMDLLDPKSQTSRRFDKAVQRYRRQQAALDQARQATQGWRKKLPVAELPAALEQAKAFEQSYFARLRPAWWRLRRILNEAYDFGRHLVRPRWSQVLDGAGMGVRRAGKTG